MYFSLFFFRSIQFIRFITTRFLLILIRCIPRFFHPAVRILREKINLRLYQESSWGNKLVDHASSYTLCVQVSSQGEWQHTKPLIESLFREGPESLKVQIYLGSQSAMKDLESWQKSMDMPKRLGVCLYPLLSYSFKTSFYKHSRQQKVWWMLCRYDFYPELVAQVFLSSGRNFLIWATPKNHNKQKRFLCAFQFTRQILTFMQRKFYQQFAVIYTANFAAEEILNSLGLPRSQKAKEGQCPQLIQSHIFRPEEILRRQLEEKQQRTHEEIFKIISARPRKVVVIGSAYLEEVEVYKSLLANLSREFNQEFYVFIVPHHCGEKYKHHQGKWQQVIDEQLSSLTIKTQLVWKMGILCEAFIYADISIIGGGWKKKTHSILEPFLAGNKIICGPKGQQHPDSLWVFDRSKPQCLMTEESHEFLALNFLNEKEMPQLEQFNEFAVARAGRQLLPYIYEEKIYRP